MNVTERGDPQEPGGAPARTRGRPLLGAVSGLLFGVFVALTLQQFGVRPLDNLSVFGLPLLGLALGMVLGRWAPLSGREPGPPGRSGEAA